MKPCLLKEQLDHVFRVLVVFIMCVDCSSSMSAEEKLNAKERTIKLFYHAYNAYMEHAYPADELMPLSCKGRYRGTELSRGDVDDSLGNFTLTLIDTLDTLAVLGDLTAFEDAVIKIIRDARFDCDVIVSVFETNIRILGGLLGGHVMATYFKRRGLGLAWYNDELLSRAKEVGDRLLPAFNTTTGIPYPRVNLKHGIVSSITSVHRDTCTACAGSMILEFAALSRLTGISVYEEKARKAMDYLWQQRHRGSDLMGTTINIHNGDWVRRESGVGAGIDSYYEYVFKAYILLGDDSYLDRFNKHYDAVMRYVSQGPLLVDVHMHKPNSVSRHFMDALLAFWPGLQVLKGDLIPAIETHEMLYQVMQRHNFIPEAFTTDFRVHWGHHPLRPEFIESTYFLYKATGDSYYLEAGKKVLDNLDKHARVTCGLAAIKNVKTGDHEDQMDSYVLAEMFKYLYLLFVEKEDLILDIDDFIFTTEAHLLPLSLSIDNMTKSLPKIRRDAYDFTVDLIPPVSDHFVTSASNLGRRSSGSGLAQDDEDGEEGEDHICPALVYTHASGAQYPHAVRTNLKEMVDNANPRRKNRKPRLRAADFIAGNKDQLEKLHVMGIRIATMADGRVQLLHTASEALTPDDAEDGMQFMQEMIELSKTQQQEAQHDPMFVHITIPGLGEKLVYRAGPAQFGYSLKDRPPVKGMLALARPYKACKEIENVHELAGHITVLERGDCMFIDKARNLQRIGAKGGIVIDHTEGSNSDSQPLFAMSGDGSNDVDIPILFLYHVQGQQLLQLLAENSFLEVVLSASSDLPSTECASSGAAASAGPVELLPSNGKTPELDPTPFLQKPDIPDAEATRRHREDMGQEAEEDEDSFLSHLDDKFYHHEAKLRDLYYLQVGTRFLHINVEVRPSALKPPPVDTRKDAFSLNVLPDGSKMVTVRVSYQASGYDQQKPQLNQMYVDAVHLLQRNTNFNDLPHTVDYLRALARCLEAGYFGMSKVDHDVLTLMRSLGRQLSYVHQYPAQPDRPDSAQLGNTPDLRPEIQPQDALPASSATTLLHPDDVQDTTRKSQPKVENKAISSSSANENVQQGQFLRIVPVDEVHGDSRYAARVDSEGRLSLVQETAEAPSRTRNTYSVHMSGDSEDMVTVRISDSEAHVSQSESFSVTHSGSSVDSSDFTNPQVSLPDSAKEPLGQSSTSISNSNSASNTVTSGQSASASRGSQAEPVDLQQGGSSGSADRTDGHELPRPDDEL